VVAPANGAKVVSAPAIPRKESGGEEATEVPAEEKRAVSMAEQIANAESGSDEPIDLEYPFTLLEIREIDAPVRRAALLASADNP
jgi:hypothetical protein